MNDATSEIDQELNQMKTKMFPCGKLFKEAVRAFRITDQRVSELEIARHALYRAGYSELAIPITKQLRRRLTELTEGKAVA